MSAEARRSPLVLRVDCELRERLERIAKQRQDTVSATARALLDEGLQRADSGAVNAQADAPGIVSTLVQIGKELALLRGITEEQTRVAFGIELLLCHWASRSAYDVSEDALLEELRQVGAEELWRGLCSWLQPAPMEAEPEEKA